MMGDTIIFFQWRCYLSMAISEELLHECHVLFLHLTFLVVSFHVVTGKQTA